MRFNVPIGLASLMLSIMLWFVVYAQTVPEPIPLRATLALDGLNDARFFVRKAPADVRLDVSAPVERAKELRDQQISASVDLSEPKEGTHDYPVAITPSWVVRFLSGTRPMARITIESVDSRTMDVTSVVKGSLRDSNLRINEKRVLPQQVTISGPASEVAAIREARVYLDLSLVDPRQPEYQEAEVIPLDTKETRPPHVHVSPTRVINSFSVGPSPSTKLASVVPDLSGVTYASSVLPDGYRLDPETITLAGKPALLANVSKAPTEVVHARGLTKTRTFRVKLVAPAGTVIVGPDTVNVTVRTVPAQPPKTEPSPTPTTPPASTTEKPR